MRFRQITLQHYRNLAWADVVLDARRTFLLGANAQGKTNFLEAAGYVTALRSFRGSDTRALIGFGQPQAGLAFVLDHERHGESRVTVALRPEGRDVLWEQTKVEKLGELLGQFPTVVFSSQDQQLLRGAPAQRRRWLDLTLAAMDGEYLRALQSYTRAVAERNMLLKHGSRDAATFEAFEHEAAVHAEKIHAGRARGLEQLGGLFAAAHARLVPAKERAGLVYAPDTAVVSAADFARQLAASRPRDLLLRSTERGPHRDDFEVVLDGRPARQFASEGQQRCLVIALRMAQAAYFHQKRGVTPVLLCDDVLGELDPERRARFWAALEGEPQVIATGTQPPAGEGGWHCLRVEAGRVTAAERGAFGV